MPLIIAHWPMDIAAAIKNFGAMTKKQTIAWNFLCDNSELAVVTHPAGALADK